MNKDISALAEQLQRIEHKVDLLLESQAMSHPATRLRDLGDPNHSCPLCFQSVLYQIDITKDHVVRKCDCSTGLTPLTFTPNTEQNNGTPNE